MFIPPKDSDFTKSIDSSTDEPTALEDLVHALRSASEVASSITDHISYPLLNAFLHSDDDHLLTEITTTQKKSRKIVLLVEDLGININDLISAEEELRR